MRYLLVVLMLIAAAQVTASGVYDVIESLAERAEEASVSSEVEVIELFHAETTEELEAALIDGYPMPWLEEILSDESIPEEDRYWLDCRVRAHVAKYLHRFYDRDGNPVDIGAEWISPGEHYWQEHLMLNPVGEDYGFGETPDYLPDFTGEPGTIMNLYGEQTGEMALTQRGIIMSRDGTIGVLKTGPADIMLPLALNYVCLIYSDGTFREIETDFIREWEHITVSRDGELIVACTFDPLLSRANGQAVVFDHDGNVLFSTEIGGFPEARPAISPDNKYIAIALNSNPTNSIVILDAHTGELLRGFPRWVRQVTFSPDGQRLAFTAASICQLTLNSQTDSWEYSTILEGRQENYFTGSSLCNDPNLVAISGKQRRQSSGGFPFTFYSELLRNDIVIYRDEGSNLDLSPNGYIAVSFNSRRASPSAYEPSFITVVSIRERG